MAPALLIFATLTCISGWLIPRPQWNRPDLVKEVFCDTCTCEDDHSCEELCHNIIHTNPSYQLDTFYDLLEKLTPDCHVKAEVEQPIYIPRDKWCLAWESGVPWEPGWGWNLKHPHVEDVGLRLENIVDHGNQLVFWAAVVADIPMWVCLDVHPSLEEDWAENKYTFTWRKKLVGLEEHNCQTSLDPESEVAGPGIMPRHNYSTDSTTVRVPEPYRLHWPSSVKPTNYSKRYEARTLTLLLERMWWATLPDAQCIGYAHDMEWISHITADYYGVKDDASYEPIPYPPSKFTTTPKPSTVTVSSSETSTPDETTGISTDEDTDSDSDTSSDDISSDDKTEDVSNTDEPTESEPDSGNPRMFL